MTERAGHDLLVALAGRLPDELLWRLRDWLASGATGPLGVVLPRELLRHRIALSDADRELLAAAAQAWGAAPRLLDAVLPLDAAPDLDVAFHPGPDGLDVAALSALAIVRGNPGCVELRQAFRMGRDHEQRVLVVFGAERPWQLTGTLQRVLRAHGDRTPCVEVLPAHGEPSPYHQAAIIGSASLWRSAAVDATPVGA